MIKMCRIFGGFISSMRQVGVNTIYSFELKCLSEKYDTKEKTKRQNKYCSMNVHNLLQLFILIMLYPTKWYASVFKQRSTENSSIHNDNFHHVAWEIKEDALFAIQEEKVRAQ